MKALGSDQLRFMKNIVDRNSTFLTGISGSGKSVCLKVLIDVINQDTPEYNLPYTVQHALLELSKQNISITAVDKLTASTLEGQTLANWVGVDSLALAEEEIISKIRINKQALKRWQRTNILIIDNINLLYPDEFDKLESIARKIRKEWSGFGGLQIIGFGDFAQQLPQINLTGSRFTFKAKIWEKCFSKTIFLTKCYRYVNESEFLRVLQDVRIGLFSEVVKKFIENKSLQQVNEEIKLKLYAREREIFQENERHFDYLEGTEFSFNAEDVGEEPYLTQLKAQSSFPNILKIKLGAQVKLIKSAKVNIVGLVNGSQGVVMGASDSSITVKFVGVEQPVEVKQVQQMIKTNGVTLASRIQFPIRVSYVTTSTQSNGMSYSNLSIDFKGCMDEGQAYAALSKANSAVNLQVVNLCESSIKASSEVNQYYKYLLQHKPTRKRKRKQPEEEESSGVVSKSKIHGKFFCMSGESQNLSKIQAKALIEKYGGKFRTAISGKTDYLIVGEFTTSVFAKNKEVSATVKYRKALERGIALLAAKEFHEMVNNEQR